MPFGPSYAPQNAQDAFAPMFTNMFLARIQEGGMRLDQFFPQEPMVGENIIIRQYETAEKAGHVLEDDHQNFQVDGQNFFRRIAYPQTFYKAMTLTMDEMSNMGNAYGIENVVQLVTDGCLESWHKQIMTFFEGAVDGKDGKVFKWNANTQTIVIDADPYPAPAAFQPQPFSAAWDLGMTVSKITRGRDMLMRNGCQPPYILFSDAETLTSLRNDPRYSGEEFAYEKALETAGLRPYGGVTGLFPIIGLPRRETLSTTGGIPVGQKAQISYLVATDYIKTFVARPWTPAVTPAVQNPTLFHVSANGRFAGMRIEEGAVVAIESHLPDTAPVAHNPVRR